MDDIGNERGGVEYDVIITCLPLAGLYTGDPESLPSSSDLVHRLVVFCITPKM